MYVSGAILRNPFLQDTDTGENHSKRNDALASEFGGQAWRTEATGSADDASEGLSWFLLLSHTDTIIYWTNKWDINMPICTLPVLVQYWATIMPVLCQ